MSNEEQKKMMEESDNKTTTTFCLMCDANLTKGEPHNIQCEKYKRESEDKDWTEVFDRNFEREFIDTGSWYACKEFIRQEIKSAEERGYNEAYNKLMPCRQCGYNDH